MDKISEIFNNIKDRLSNPFIFSFLISWLVYNWRIPVALFWFDEKQISANGCSSIFEFIADDWKRNGYFWTPLFIGLGYTFLFPIFKNLISAFQTWTLKWGEEWNLSISKGSKISLEKYLTLRESYIKEQKKLEELISSESIFINELESKSQELEESNEKLGDVTKKYENVYATLTSYNNVEIIYDSWLYADTETEYEINIDKKGIYRRNPFNNVLVYKIIFFQYNFIEKKIIMIKELHNHQELNNSNEEKLIVCDLEFIDENQIVGTENYRKVKYKRLIEELPF